jgi:hypothetical protein
MGKDDYASRWEELLFLSRESSPAPPPYDGSPEITRCLAVAENTAAELLAEEPAPKHGRAEYEVFDVLEDRGVEISNYERGSIAGAVPEMARAYGDIEAIDFSGVDCGRVIVKFFDLRSAYRMIRERIHVGGCRWQTQFAQPERIACRQKPPNNGTIIVFRLPPDIPEQKLQQHFSSYGDIREVRKSANSYFVEFWDTRDCERAFSATKGARLFGTKVSIEYSRPGGRRKNPEAYAATRMPVIARAVKKPPPVTTAVRRDTITASWM